MRDFIAICLLLACLTVVVASLISFLRPLPRLGLATRKRSFSGLGLGLALFIATVFAIPPIDADGGQPTARVDTPPAAKSAAMPAPRSDAPSEKTLGFRPETLAERINALSAQADQTWRVNSFKIEKNAFTHVFSKHAAITGSTAANGQVNSLVVMSNGDGSLSSGADAVMVMAIIQAAVMDQRNLEESGKVIFDLLEEHQNGEAPSTTIMNDVSTQFSQVDGIGNILTISRVNAD